jgi:hypothetical protein
MTTMRQVIEQSYKENLTGDEFLARMRRMFPNASKVEIEAALATSIADDEDEADKWTMEATLHRRVLACAERLGGAKGDVLVDVLARGAAAGDGEAAYWHANITGKHPTLAEITEGLHLVEVPPEAFIPPDLEARIDVQPREGDPVDDEFVWGPFDTRCLSDLRRASAWQSARLALAEEAMTFERQRARSLGLLVAYADQFALAEGAIVVKELERITKDAAKIRHRG